MLSFQILLKGDIEREDVGKNTEETKPDAITD